MIESTTFSRAPVIRASDGASLLRQLSHTATRTKDMEAIRHFYEDFLGLPLVVTMTADFDAVTNSRSNYVHCFFELADGSFVAFFQFEDGYRGEPAPRTSDPYERHLALRVDDIDTVHRYEVRAKEFSVDHFIVDHDDFYSLYLVDPDGEQVEVAWHKPSLASLVDGPKAHRDLEEWLASARKD